MKTLHYFIVLIMVVSISACDFSTGSTDSTAQVDQEKFSVNADASNRIIFGDYIIKKDDSNSNSSMESSDGGFSFVAKIAPPNGNYRASHLDVLDGELVVGYKTRGEAYGGGIDIITFNGSNLDRGATIRELTTRAFDVQEVAYFNGRLYVAAAAEPKKKTDIPAVVLQVNTENGNIEASDYIEGNVAKALALNQKNNDELFVISDKNHLYKYDISNSSSPFINRKMLTAGSGVEFRSVGARGTNGSAIVTIDQQGKVYSIPPSFNEIGNPTNASVNSTINTNTDLQISRVSYFTTTNPDHVLVSLNQYGFRQLNPAGQTVWFDSQSQEIDDTYASERYYLTISGYDPCAGEKGNCKELLQVYAAGSGSDGNNYIDHFTYNEQGNSPNAVPYKAKIDLSMITNQVGNGQINDIHVTENYMYVAKGTDGVFVFRRN